MNSAHLIRESSRVLLAFICSLFIFALMILGTLKLTLFNQEYMINRAQQADYAGYVAKDINNSIVDLGLGSNIPEGVLDNVVSKAITQDNIDSYIRGIYTEVPFNMTGQDTVKTAIDNAIQQYADEKGIEIDDQMKDNIDNLKTAAIDVFDQYIELPYLLTYGQRVMQYSQTLLVMMIICGVIALLLIIAVVSLSGRWWHRRLRYLAYALGGAGLMMFVLPAVIYFRKIVSRIGINTESLYRLVANYLEHVLLYCMWVGIAGVVSALVIWLISELLRKKAVQKRS